MLQQVPFAEPIPVHDIFVTDVAKVDYIGGGNFRLTFVAEQASLHDGRNELVVVCRLIAGLDSIRRGIFFVAKAIGMTIIAVFNGGRH